MKRFGWVWLVLALAVLWTVGAHETKRHRDEGRARAAQAASLAAEERWERAAQAAATQPVARSPDLHRVYRAATAAADGIDRAASHQDGPGATQQARALLGQLQAAREMTSALQRTAPPQKVEKVLDLGARNDAMIRQLDELNSVLGSNPTDWDAVHRQAVAIRIAVAQAQHAFALLLSTP